jgi:ABC-type Mn2+/Zn2+ transport system ATPase subunit
MVICDDFNLSLARGSKVALVGPNGIGKTTMLRLLEGELRADSDAVEWGYEASVGYMPQEHGELIEKSDQSALEWLWAVDPSVDQEDLRALFGRLLFRKEEPMKPPKVLSGGETVRLLLARLMLLQPNVLLLDERPQRTAPRSCRRAVRSIPWGESIVSRRDRSACSPEAIRQVWPAPSPGQDTLAALRAPVKDDAS